MTAARQSTGAPATIYLDYNATTPLLPAAREAMMEAMEGAHNPSSVHGAGRAARQRLETARRAVAESVSAWPNEVIFCASGTEANALAMHGTPAVRFMVSAIEHNSVLSAMPGVERLPVDAEGLLDLDKLEEKLASCQHGKPFLVSVMLANNETGVIQPVTEIARRVHAANGLLHVDAAQALGKIAVDMGMLGADLLTLCAHKFGGPLGAAALVVRNDVNLRPMFLGGGQESRRRAGTENVMAIAGFAAAVMHAPDLSVQRAWLDAMERRLQQRCLGLGLSMDTGLGLRIASGGAQRLPNTSCLALPGLKSETQMMHLDLSGLCVSAGSACSSGRMEASHVLLAMGWSREDAASAIRVSTGWGSRESDLAAFETAWLALVARRSGQAA